MEVCEYWGCREREGKYYLFSHFNNTHERTYLLCAKHTPNPKDTKYACHENKCYSLVRWQLLIEESPLP